MIGIKYIASLLLVTGALALPECVPGSYKLIPKNDCKGYFLCVFGRPVEMPDCPTGSAFSRQAHVCVPKGSLYDDCTTETKPKPTDKPINKPLTIEEQCAQGARIIPHPTECQAYYNCSHKYETVPRLLEQYMMECSYPKLFNAEATQCDSFENVKCGSRSEYKNGCDYRSNQCPSAHCIPCGVRIPNCEGKKDGINAHEQKLWSPYFVMCYKERTMSEQVCPPDNDGRTQLFHPDLNECVPLDQIPREHGGMMPDCSGKADGYYLDDFGRCNQYTVCQEGRFLNNVKCMEGEVFDAMIEACVKAEEACGPCGGRTDC